MNFRCRMTKPLSLSWRDVEAETPEDAAQAYHEREINASQGGIKYPVEKDGQRYVIYFATVEIEGHGELVSRVYSYGIWRKGRQATKTIESVAQGLGWEHDPKMLLDEGWDGEETYEQAAKRSA